MSEHKHRHTGASSGGDTLARVDWDCLVKDVLKQWYIILLAALSAALMTGAVMKWMYVPEYSATTTFVIGKNGFSNNMIYENLNSAEDVTALYQHIVESTVLKKEVCESLGLDSYQAATEVTTVTNSNLMNLRVTAGSPKLAYEISKAINENATELMTELGDSITIHVLTAPTVPVTVSNPLSTTGYMKYAALIAALVVACLFGFVSNAKDTIKNKKDIERKLDAKLLGTIYHEKKRKAKHQLRKKVSLLLDQPLLSFKYVESCRLLASRIALGMKQEGAKSLLVTSVSENEGKSTVAANISLSLAQEGYRVFLVDCDFRKPSQYKIFEIDKNEASAKDFTSTISDRNEIRFVRYMENGSLNLVLTVKPKRKPWDKESMDYLKKVIRMLKKYADYVIIDTAPMSMVADTEEYASLADASVLVVMQDVMESGYINDAIDTLKNSGTNLMGCVFNNVHAGISERFGVSGKYGSGYYGYGSYSHSDKKSKENR